MKKSILCDPNGTMIRSRPLLAWLLAVCVLFAFAGGRRGAFAEEGPDGTDPSEPRHGTSYYFEETGKEWYEVYHKAAAVLESYFKRPYVGSAENTPLADIPVYYGDELFFYSVTGAFGIGIDSALINRSGSAPGAAALLTEFPDAAFRKMPNSDGLLVYESETGVRMFARMEYSRYAETYQCLRGFTLLIKEKHEYADFAGIKVGDPIDAVCAVDPVGEIYKKLGLLMPDNVFENDRELGFPFTGVHYLTDGLLVFEYKKNEAGELIVDSIEYCEDYKLRDHAKGRETDYRLFDCDLPYEWDGEPAVFDDGQRAAYSKIAVLELR